MTERRYSPARLRNAARRAGIELTDAEYDIVVAQADAAIGQFDPDSTIGTNFGTIPQRATRGFFALIGDIWNDISSGNFSFERLIALISGSDETANRRAAFADGVQASHLAYREIAARIGGDRGIQIARAVTGNGVFSDDSLDAQLRAANGVTAEDERRGISVNPGAGDRPDERGGQRYAMADADPSQNFSPSSRGGRSSPSALTVNG